MNIFKSALLVTATATLTTFGASSFAQEPDHAYTEGSVVTVSYVRTEPGRFDDYVKYLATTYKTLMEEYKKAGVILDYGVYSTNPVNATEPDLILTTTYKNLAAMDNLNERTDPIGKKIWGSLQASNQASIDRGKMRTLVGDRLLRQLILK
jgi:hypothetical protein